MTLQSKLPGHRCPGGAAADNRDARISRGRKIRPAGVDTGFSQKRYIHRLDQFRLFGTGGHARIRAQVTADSGRKRGVSQGQIDGFIDFASAPNGDVVWTYSSGRSSTIDVIRVLACE